MNEDEDEDEERSSCTNNRSLSIHSPNHQQNGSVQAPLQRPEPDALDPDQLAGFILTQTENTAARHGAEEEEEEEEEE